MLLDQAAELANQGRFDRGGRGVRATSPAKGLTAAAYYLMGMICQAAGDRRRAEDCFHKTVYLDPRHDEALLALALLAERRGDHERRRRLPPPRRANREHDQEASEVKWRRTQPHPDSRRRADESPRLQSRVTATAGTTSGSLATGAARSSRSFIHCRNCPVFAAAARTFFDRPAPEGYLADWSRWLAGRPAMNTR